MSELLGNSPTAREWAAQAIQRNSSGAYGALLPAVIWIDDRNENGELLVPLDPSQLVASINSAPYPLTEGHDPGKPQGRVLEGREFESDEGRKFVAAVIGYYAGGDVLSFTALALDVHEAVPLPEKLPALPANVSIQLGTDPREFDDTWVDEVIHDAPFRIEHIELSHNAAISVQELIITALPYVCILWNPFVTAIGTEAGKATFAAVNKWLHNSIGRLSDRRNPILAMQSSYGGCDLSFLLRGKDVKQHYIAHQSLSTAAAQAANLVKKLKARGIPAKELLYEFDKDAARWYPSHAILEDGRMIASNTTLIAIEQLPKELSLGVSRGPVSPIV